LAEREALTTRVLGVAFDGTGYGDDGAIWGGEFFAGSVAEGLERVGHLRPAQMPGGDGAAAFPLQAAAGFVAQLDAGIDVGFALQMPARYRHARQLVAKGVRTFTTTSAGRLFDAAAAVLGWTEPVTFEAQAAIWLEQQAGAATEPIPIPFDYAEGELDWRPALQSVIRARLAGKDIGSIALGFHVGLARGIAQAVVALCCELEIRIVVLTGGVFQNELLRSSLTDVLAAEGLDVWVNRAVPPGDGGLSLGQAAVASLRT
jgi:hydrogenase maturation protein HypF